MNDMEKRNLEDAFKDAFREAGVSPSEKVWTNIELDLERAEAGKMKRTLFFYKMLAAASIAFAMCIAGVGYYAVYKSPGSTFGNDHQLASDLKGGEATQYATPDPLALQESTSTPGNIADNRDAIDHNSDNNTQDDGASTASDLLTPQESVNTQGNKGYAVENGNTAERNAAKHNRPNASDDRTLLSSAVDPSTPKESVNTQGNKEYAVENGNTAGHNAAKHNRSNTSDDRTLLSSAADPSTPKESVNTQGNNGHAVESRSNAVKHNRSNTSGDKTLLSSAADPSILQKSADPQDNTNQAIGDKPAAGHYVAEQTTLNSSVASSEKYNEQGAGNTQRSSTDQKSPTNKIAGVQDASDASAANAGHEGVNKNLTNARALPALTNSKAIALQFPKTEADPVALMFARLEQRERDLAEQGEKKKKKEDEIKEEKLWTSVGFAAGGFNPVNTGISPTSANSLAFSNSSSVADKQVKASGVTYAAGVSLGTQLSKRWMLQGGVNYLTQMSDYTATQAFGSADLQSFKAASINDIRAGADAQMESKVVSTAPYTVNNNVQFISVPMQAGYLILNKKFALQLNAGVSTDLFLQNTIEPQGGDLGKTTQGSGENSPYRTVNFSGLVGTEFSYKFSNRYRIALNPGLHYPFSSIYKSDSGLSGTPLTFDVGLRFRYIFH